LGTCIGDACCSPGLVYDTNMNQCVPDGSANINRNSRASQESFINNILTKTQPANYKIAYDLRQPKPFNN
jgi:hypothetical protein